MSDEATPKQVLFIQGGGEGAHAIDADLASNLAHLLGTEYELRYPRMPKEASPDYSEWKPALLDELSVLDDGAFLVAHSVGAAVVVRLLAEGAPPRRIGGLFLIAAPYVGEGGWQIGEFETPKDLGAHLSQELPIYLYHGTDDAIVPFAHLDLYAKVLPRAHLRQLPGRDHQLEGDLSEVARDLRALATAERDR